MTLVNYLSFSLILGFLFIGPSIRKLQDETKIPGKFDVKGTGAITDMVHNVFIWWRNKPKEEGAAEVQYPLVRSHLLPMRNMVAFLDRHYMLAKCSQAKRTKNTLVVSLQHF